MFVPEPGIRGLRREASGAPHLFDLAQLDRRPPGRRLALRGEGEPGKTALLNHLCASTPATTFARAAGIESEMGLPFASLHQLCEPFLNRLGELPDPQREALETVFGLRRGVRPDRFIVGLAVLSLFAEVARERPLLCVIDDAHWLDEASASTLAFAARRLRMESVGILFAARAEGEGDFTLRGEGWGAPLVEWATAMHLNARGRFEDALAAARAATERRGPPPSPASLYELVEAAVRSSHAETATGALEELARTTSVVGTELARGLEARARALLSHDETAESLHLEAIRRFERVERADAELARAHLVYGEWLRREGRRCDSREALRAAKNRFTAGGMAAFAERAGNELRATGERARRRGAETRDDLTAQERRISELACDGLSNPEIGMRLFLSPRTVEWHLGKVYSKLGIRSRRELAKALVTPEAELVLA